MARPSTRPARALLGVLLAGWLLLSLAGCDYLAGSEGLSRRGKDQWQRGEYENAARSFVALTEIYPRSLLTEESTFWAACLYQYYLNNPALAGRYYRQLLQRYPDGEFLNDARQNLADVYEENLADIPRAALLYRQLLTAPELRERRDGFQVKLAQLYLRMGRLDQARYELRILLKEYPGSSLRGLAYYLAGYSYYLEKRPRVALAVFAQTLRDFPGTPIAAQAQFFMADTQEEQGNLQDALHLFQGLQGKYHDEKIVEKRIQTLQTRMRRGVR